MLFILVLDFTEQEDKYQSNGWRRVEIQKIIICYLETEQKKNINFFKNKTEESYVTQEIDLVSSQNQPY